MSKVLFEITEDHLETGMRGYPVGYCTTSTVDPNKGLFYMGQCVADLALKQPEEVIYLLYHGKMPTPEELSTFSALLHERSHCSKKVEEHIRQLPREGHPMKLLSAALLICGMIEGKGDYKEDCLNLIAKIPEIVASVINHHAGWGVNNPSKPELGYMENFTQMLQIPNADYEQLAHIFKLFNVLHFDHGGGNLSCFIGKGVASGLEEMYGSISSALCALSGPRHGKANQDCLRFVHQVLDELGEEASEKDVEKLIRARLAEKKLIYGFGHAVLRVEDPRAAVFYQEAEQHYASNPLVKIATLLRKVGPKVLGENPKISDPFPNVDAISGTVLTAAGFPFPEYYTVLFGLSRTVGIAIQVVYERLEARGGKGTPIIRPKYLFKK